MTLILYCSMWILKALPIQGNPFRIVPAPGGVLGKEAPGPCLSLRGGGWSGHPSVYLPTQTELGTDTQFNYHAELLLEAAGGSWHLLLQSTISANN